MTTLLKPRADEPLHEWNADSSTFGDGAELIAGGAVGTPSVFQIDSADAQSQLLRNDAGCGSGIFPAGDLTRIMDRVLEQKLSPLTAAAHFPIDRDAGWAESLEMYSMSGVGDAKEICCNDDFPLVSVDGCTFKTGFMVLGTGYEICYSTLRTQGASKRGINKEVQLARIGYQAIRKAANSIAYLGSLKNSILGVGNNPFLPMQVSPYRLDNAVTNPQAILAVLTEASTMNYVTSGMAATMPDAVIGPPSLMQYLSRRPAASADASACCAASVMQQFASFAPHIKYWGMANEMENIGPNGERALFFYKRDRESIAWHYPISLDVLQPRWDGYSWRVNMIARVGSLWPTYPEDSLLLVGV